MPQNPVILIGGPTASGKSALALRLARERNGSIINADAMQIYAGLPLLTAQPAPDDRAAIPHFLYETADAAEASSAGKWLAQAQAAIAAVQAEGRTPIVVGGTGMYFTALRGGLSDIPPIPADVWQQAENLYAQLGEPAFRAELAKRDPAGAARIARNDRQRLIRAYEVAAHTGKTLHDWHKKPSDDKTQESRNNSSDKSGLVSSPLRGGLGRGESGMENPECHLLLPPRDELYANCDRRFATMIERGAIDEVRNLLARNLSPALPAMKILGVREIASYLRGDITLDAAIAKAQQMTRNYAKRQMTWFRNSWQD